MPLIEANMVASLYWRRQIEEMTKRSQNDEKPEFHMLPVALDTTSYQMPRRVRNLNYIRHIDAEKGAEDEALLSRLTFAISQVFLRALSIDSGQAKLPQDTVTPIKIFLSHAKADGTDVPKEIKSYIQTETQCHTFFDENDINYGLEFGDVIDDAIESESAGLLIIQGDHYADRPWCRREVRDFLKPHRIDENRVEDGGAHRYSVMPAVVVTNFAGDKIARTIPELGHAPCLQWKDGGARRVVVAMLREILFSGFYRLLAKATAEASSIHRDGSAGANTPINRFLLNRAPDPVMLELVFRDSNVDRKDRTVVFHPGHGLSKVEKGGLQVIYPDVEFAAFGSGYQTGDSSEPEKKEYQGKVLAVSISNSKDILKAGIGDDHAVELLRAILRPLFRKGLSLLYGGAPPGWKEEERPWDHGVNFTNTFLEHLLAENSFEEVDVTDQPKTLPELKKPRLFNISAWPYSERLTIEDEANWVNVCSFIKVPRVPGSGMGGAVEPAPFENTREWRLSTALTLTEMRKMSCRTIQCDIPDAEGFKFQPLAHLFIGGKLSGFSSGIPGVWEEILHAFDAERPVFVLGACRGAAGRIAHWLANPPANKPAELHYDYFLKSSKNPIQMSELASDIAKVTPDEAPQRQLDRLWGHITATSRPSLAHLENTDLDLLSTSNHFANISAITHNGLNGIISTLSNSD
ncbi:MAG: TIR domain-containing protein [Gammaproteobacteria bacterium]